MKQPEALRLADVFDDEIKWQTTPISRTEVAAELRRLHEENAKLRDALHNISLCSQNSMSIQRQCGEIARAALGGERWMDLN